MVQHIKALATKPDTLSSSPRTHMVKGETYTQNCPLICLCTYKFSFVLIFSLKKSDDLFPKNWSLQT